MRPDQCGTFTAGPADRAELDRFRTFLADVARRGADTVMADPKWWTYLYGDDAGQPGAAPGPGDVP